jgi:hypothetical protein
MMVVLQPIRKEPSMSRSRMNDRYPMSTYRQQLLSAMRLFLVAPLFVVATVCGVGRCGP